MTLILHQEFKRFLPAWSLKAKRRCSGVCCQYGQYLCLHSNSSLDPAAIRDRKSSKTAERASQKASNWQYGFVLSQLAPWHRQLSSAAPQCLPLCITIKAVPRLCLRAPCSSFLLLTSQTATACRELTWPSH